MADLLHDKYNRHNLVRLSDWNPGSEFIPCVAHVIHNAAIAFLTAMSATPADDYHIFDRSEEYGGLEADIRSQRRSFPKLALLSGFARTLEKLRMIAMATTNSTQRGEQFQHLVKEAIGKNLNLKLDVKTRWHSTATMLTRALRLRQPIMAWLLMRQELELLTLDNREWAQAEMILNLLRPFWTAALGLMGGPSQISIHLTFGLYNYLFNHIDGFIDKLETGDTNGNPTPARNQLIAGLQATRQFMVKYYTPTDKLQSYTASVLLNPTIKGDYFTSIHWQEPSNPHTPFKDEYEAKLKDMFIKYYAVHAEYDNTHSSGDLQSNMSCQPFDLASPSPSRVSSRSGSSLFFGRRAEKCTEGTSLAFNPARELEEYLLELPIDQTHNETHEILQYWQTREQKWPLLTVMARDVLAVPATGADVERMFSQGRNLITYHRHKLSDKVIADAMFMKGACSRKRKVREEIFAEEHTHWNDVRVLGQEFDDDEFSEAAPELPDLFLQDHEERLVEVLLNMDSGSTR